MKKLSLVATLAFAGCSCASTHTTDVGIDASTPDAGLDASLTDAFFAFPDVPVRAPLCGPITAVSCPIQSASTVSACASGEGAVFFDGVHCQETPSLGCGAERGAFGSFEECAVVCAETYCDASKLFDSRDEPLECETPISAGPACGGGSIATTPLPGWTLCASFAPMECYASDQCARDPQVGNPNANADLWLFFRRASLLPFVSRLTCDNGI